MRPCPNCGQDAPTSDRFCPHCGALLPWARAASAIPQAPAPPPASPQASPSAPTSTPQGAYTPPAQPGPAYPQQPGPAYSRQEYAPPAQPRQQPAPVPQASYTAQPSYVDPNAYAPGGQGAPTAYAPNAPGPTTPAYLSGGVVGGNLPMPRVQQAPPPVAPAQGANPFMNTLLGLGQSFGARDTRGLLRLAAILLAAVVALVVVFKVVSFLLGLLLPILLIVAAIVVAWQYRRYRRVRRRLRP